MKTAQTKICLIIGDPVGHSLSPLMHNVAYEVVGLGEKFVYLASNVHVSKMEEVISSVRTLGIVGLTCTVPHKIAVMPYLDEVDETAKKIGAVNSVLHKDGKLKGYNTDWIGAITPLKKRTKLNGKKVLVLGAGGAARAVVYGLLRERSQVTVVNRTTEKAHALAEEFGCAYATDTNGGLIASQDIIINTTSVGMHPNEHASPINGEGLHSGQILMDIVYAPYDTAFLALGKKVGASIIHGTEMLLYQGTAQFELYTGVKAPVEIMEKTLHDALSI
ncbi:MAG: shikimate dehydrogenase [Microgenomates group bacterium]